MGIEKEVVSRIKADINELEETELGELIIPGDFLYEFPDLEELLMPGPDVLPGISEPELYDRMDILGSYTPMSSPGVVRLHAKNIRRFFWSVIKKCMRGHFAPFFTKPDLERLSELIVAKSYHHEVFHFSCDVLRNLFGSTYEMEMEEALAVAYSRRHITGQRSNATTGISKINAVLYNLVISEAYKYTSPGYRDWMYYNDDSLFKAGLLAYIRPGNCDMLRGNGVPVEDLIFPMVGNVTGYIEKIV